MKSNIKSIVGRIFALFTPLIFVTLFTGCATVINGTKGPFEITTEPPMAQVEIHYGKEYEDTESAWTPHTFVIPKKHDLLVVITRDGYEPVRVRANSFKEDKLTLGGAASVATTAISPLVGGPFMVVDYFSGARRTRNGIHVTLKPLPQTNVVVMGAASPPMNPPQPVEDHTWRPIPRWIDENGNLREFTEFQFGKVRQNPPTVVENPPQPPPTHYRPAGGQAKQAGGRVTLLPQPGR